MRPKNEDTYYISDDAAGGKGFSSESFSDPDRGESGKQGARGVSSSDGATSHALGGGMKSKWEARKAVKKGESGSSVGFYGVYDGHCGRLASEVSITHTSHSPTSSIHALYMPDIILFRLSLTNCHCKTLFFSLDVVERVTCRRVW